MSILTYYQDACKTISANAEISCTLHNSGGIVLCDLLPPEIKGLIMFCLDFLTKGGRLEWIITRYRFVMR